MTYLQKAVELAGGQNPLARKITQWHAEHGTNLVVKQQYVWKWLNADTIQPPAEHCRAIEEITNSRVTRYNLRPDVFGSTPDCNNNQNKEAA